MIGPFRGRYKFLCNFYVSYLKVDGVVYPSSEHAFQALKYDDPDLREEVASAKTPAMAKKVGRRYPCRKDWEIVKESAMRHVLEEKFAKGTKLARLLDDTGDKELVEVNHWGDKFWGAVYEGGSLVGKNMLGRLLMQVRENNRVQS